MYGPLRAGLRDSFRVLLRGCYSHGSEGSGLRVSVVFGEIALGLSISNFGGFGVEGLGLHSVVEGVGEGSLGLLWCWVAGVCNGTLIGHNHNPKP